jgi:hypothetical protein
MGPIQGAETFPGAYRRIELLPPLGDVDAANEKRVLQALVRLAENEKCAKAFAKYGLATVKDSIMKGVVVGSRGYLEER